MLGALASDCLRLNPALSLTSQVIWVSHLLLRDPSAVYYTCNILVTYMTSEVL